MKSRSRARHGLALILGCSVLGACAQQRPPPPPTPSEVPPPKQARRSPPPVKVVEKKIVERCPNEAEIERLRAAKPKPLRDQAMPATTAERVARTAAQLGLYEATGRWADQVEKSFRDCEAK